MYMYLLVKDGTDNMDTRTQDRCQRGSYSLHLNLTNQAQSQAVRVTMLKQSEEISVLQLTKMITHL